MKNYIYKVRKQVKNARVDMKNLQVYPYFGKIYLAT